MKSLLAFIFVLSGCQVVVEFQTPRETGEQCGDAVDNDGNGAVDCEDGGCAGTARCLGCGDGALDRYEECDDGNIAPDDGCNPSCILEMCGDGVQQPGEQCDDGNAIDTDGCLTACTLPSCGDGFVHGGIEQCDDGGVALDDGCNSTCAVERCGDGVQQSGPFPTQYEFLYLASSCSSAGQDFVEFRVNGNFVGAGGPNATCSCQPGGFQSVGGEGQVPINGFNDFTVDYSGTDHFLAWAVVRVSDGTNVQEILIYEGTPGAAAARATSMCNGGFAENVLTTVNRPVRVNEACDDGNTINGDACNNNCFGGA